MPTLHMLDEFLRTMAAPANHTSRSQLTAAASAALLAALTACSAGGPWAAPSPSPDGSRPARISTVAGTGAVCTPALLPCGDGGTASRAPLGTPDAATALPDGGYLIAERDVEKIRRVSPEGVISTLTGTGHACPQPTSPCGDGGPASQAQIHHPHFVIATPDGGYLIADRLDNRVRKVSAAGVITTVAGTGEPCRPQPDTCGDGGPATSARITYPQVISLLPRGGFLVGGLENRIRQVTPTGLITTVAGTGVPCPGPTNPCGDGGRATSARFNDTHGVAALPAGGFLVVDRKDNRIRKVTAAGKISTVAGTGATCDPTASPCGGGGAAIAAALNAPIGVELTAGGGFLILDGGANQVRHVSAAGLIQTVAGTGAFCEPAGPAPKTETKAGQGADPESGACGDGGPALEAALSSPHSAAFVPAGVIVDDRDDNRIRLLSGTGLRPA
jgi:serine/threonine-protein kinase